MLGYYEDVKVDMITDVDILGYMMAEVMSDEDVVKKYSWVVCNVDYVGEETWHMSYSRPEVHHKKYLKSMT